MKPKKTMQAEDPVIILRPIQAEIATVFLIGASPLIIHSMSWKAKQELLLPGKKKNRAEREGTLKHDPLAEFRECFYEVQDDAESAIVLPGSAFKGAVESAALRMPGATKTEISQLLHVMDEWVPVFGIPQLHMSVVRNSGMNKTPDIRSRPILPKWCARLSVRFITPQLSLDTVGALFGGAGQIIGVGDFRPEKGAGNFGRFDVVSPNESGPWKLIERTGNANMQRRAIEKPECYDREAARLLSWFQKESNSRGFQSDGGVRSKK